MLKKNFQSSITDQVLTADALAKQKEEFTDLFHLDFNELFKVYCKKNQEIQDNNYSEMSMSRPGSVLTTKRSLLN